MSNKWIVIHVSSTEQAKFFLRFVHTGNGYRYSFAFITYTYSVYRFVKERLPKGNYLYFLNKYYYVYGKDTGFKINERESLECLTRYMSTNNANRAFYAAIGVLKKLGSQNIKYIWCWNGCKVIDHALTDFANKYNIKTLYFEIANIDGKIFVDPVGTNSRSFLYKHVDFLKSYNVDLEAYASWKHSYIKAKYAQTTVKQARKIRIKEITSQYLWDDYGYFLCGGVFLRQFPRVTLQKKINRINYQFTKADFTNLHYIFFPLQVSSDTQVLLNGNISLLDAINYVLEYAKRKGIYVVIKPHPAERNPLYFKEMYKRISSYNKVILSNENTFYLIQNAEKVFTINSTVGLETMILNRPLHVFGKALYENFNKEDISRYIMGYLLNIDYWGDGDISNQDFLNVLQRADLSY